MFPLNHPEKKQVRYRNGYCGMWTLAAAVMALCILALPPVALSANPKPQTAALAPALEKAPDFVLKDLKGQKFRLSDRKGKQPVLLIFGTTWCTYCKSEIPRLKQIYANYAKQGLEVVNIDIQETKEKVSRFASQNQLPYTVLLDEDGIVSGVYDIRGVPAMILIDKNGFIVCRQCRNLESLIEAALKKN